MVRNCAWFLSRHLNWTHQQQLFFLVSNFTFCFQSARLEPYKIEQEWNHMVLLLPRPTLCTRTYTSRLLCMFFSSVNAFWTNLEIPALLSRGTVTEFLSIKSRVCTVSFSLVIHLKELLLGSTMYTLRELFLSLNPFPSGYKWTQNFFQSYTSLPYQK